MAAVGGVLIVLTGVLWATGGLRSQPNGPVAVKPGVAIDQGRFTVQVLDARIAQVKPPLGDKTVSALLVRLRVANKGKDSAYVGGDLKDGLVGEPRPGTYLEPSDVTGTAAGGKATYVYPGLPIDAEAMWELKPGTAPRQITIALRQWQFGPGFTDLTKHWSVDKGAPMKAKVTLPVGRQ